MNDRCRLRSLAVAVLLSGIAGEVACSDRPTEDACYPRDEALDHVPPQQGPPQTPYCDWAYGELPDPPQGYAHTNRVFLSFDPTDAEPCDPCDVERFDALLRDEVEQDCDLPYRLVRGCYVPPEETTNGSCWVAGLYFSDCDPP